MKNKWIILAVICLVVVLIAAVVGVNVWFHSGNVRLMGNKLRVEFTGVGYIIDQETGEVTGQTMIAVNGKTTDADAEIFDGDLLVYDYYNEADGTLTDNKAVREGDDGFWEIHNIATCQHVEEKEDGTSEVVNHSCRYRFIYYVHPQRQDFLVVRVKDKYEMYPVYVVLADSEEEAVQIYKDFKGDKF